MEYMNTKRQIVPSERNDWFKWLEEGGKWQKFLELAVRDNFSFLEINT
jgi:hypothetical protein